MTQEQNNNIPRTIEPCEHMEHWVNGLSDGSLKGPARVYTRFHMVTCVKCRTAFAALEVLHHRLQGLSQAPEPEPKSLTPDRQEALDAAMDSIDKRQVSDTRP